MANKKSSKKDIRRIATRTAQNRTVRSRIKTLAKTAAASADAEALKKSGAELASALDKASKKNIVHPNKVARVKSRLAKAAAKLAK
ncbi:MAG: 30S ribosomal protein S20 [Opitutales bacterium]|nr:30S ribosomal protein S20 [Opitutales bacterium]